eukprot:COSAG05_NODE_207_length_14113_cov_13.452119_6_plen_42_part_00
MVQLVVRAKRVAREVGCSGGQVPFAFAQPILYFRVLGYFFA